MAIGNALNINTSGYQKFNATNGSFSANTTIPPADGGTGVSNASGSTITLGGALTTSGAFTTTFTMTGNTSVTFPTSGTLATTSQLISTPVSVANGGTGDASFTNHSALIASGTTDTGAFQNIASVATGQVLVSAGTSTIPAWSSSPTVTSITFGSGTALSVYQEGTWTPTVTGGSVAGTTTYTNQVGYYTKIGDTVFLYCLVSYTAATGTGNVVIGGLPFTVKNQTNYNPISAIGVFGSITWPAGSTQLVFFPDSNTTTARIQGNGSNFGGGNLQMVNTSVSIYINTFYRV